MSQVPSHFETSVPAADSGETPPYSVAAIISLISGLLFCIPGMMILGLICGFGNEFVVPGTRHFLLLKSLFVSSVSSTLITYMPARSSFNMLTANYCRRMRLRLLLPLKGTRFILL